MNTFSIIPDVYTFGSLAKGCRRIKDGIQLLDDMEVRKFAGLCEFLELLTSLRKYGVNKNRILQIFYRLFLENVEEILPN